MRFAIGIVLLFTVCGLAQPRWNRYAGDFYHPTGFPLSDWDPWYGYGDAASLVIGDLDGDGDDDYFSLITSGFIVATRDTDTTCYHWTSFAGSAVLIPLGECTGGFAMNLDTDPAEELLLYQSSGTVSCWKAATFNPWTWQQRDDLLEGLHFPGLVQKGIFGDFDGDGLLNGAYIINGGMNSQLIVTERNASGAWMQEYAFSVYFPVGIYDGDFDHDGDVDFGVMEPVPDFWVVTDFFENTGSSLQRRYAWAENLAGPLGGDLDGDGQWEGLFRLYGRPDFTLVEVAADSQDFVVATELRSLASVVRPVFGNFRIAGEQVVAGIQREVVWEQNAPVPLFRTVRHTCDGWRDLENGFGGLWFEFLSGNMADVDGDGLNDILAIVDQRPTWSRRNWMLWPNSGTTTDDFFTGRNYLNRVRWLENPDTVFSSPQIGDITGDGLAEFAVLAQRAGQPSQILFFDMHGQFADYAFSMIPAMAAGLPTGFQRFYLADVVADSCCELIGYRGWWEIYLRIDGVWHPWYGILPPELTGDIEISIADANNDGLPDLFMPDAVLLSLTRAAADDRIIPVPQQLALTAYPNPFNSILRINYDVPRAQQMELAVFNVLGQKVETLFAGTQTAGAHEAAWSPRGAGGIYFLSLTAGTQTQTTKVLYIR